MLIRTLSVLECTRLLGANRVARLACAKDGQPYVVPLHYAYSDAHLYAFSMPGKKIEWMRAIRWCLFRLTNTAKDEAGGALSPMAVTRNCPTGLGTRCSAIMPGRC